MKHFILPIMLLAFALQNNVAFAQSNPDLSHNVIIVGNKKFYPLKSAHHYYPHTHTPLLPHSPVTHGVKVIRPSKDATSPLQPTADVLKAPATPSEPTPPSSPIVQGVASAPQPQVSSSPATAKDVLSLFEPEEPPIKH